MDPQVLDLSQLARIQGTHRGFLYQHLYAVACLLLAPSTGVTRVRVERDEDVEVVHDAVVVYAQVKTRGGPLSPSDIVGVLDRFQGIREAHARGDRAGAAQFALVTNVELGPALAAQSWPQDVLVVTPTTTSDALAGTGLLVPPRTVATLLAEVQRHAEGYRLSALRPDSLVAKLVGFVAHAAAGERTPPSFATTELERLCELVAAQVRPLPRVPAYRPQVNEPTLPNGRSSLIVLGHAGDGKSAWAAEMAAHTSEVAVYHSCSAAPGEQLAARLVDAAVSTLVADGTVRPYDLVLPGRTGVEALALLEQQLVSRGIVVVVTVDDCHNTSSAMLVEAMRTAPSIRWVLLGRPCNALDEVAALMSIPCATLEGWDDDAIAALLEAARCSTRPADVAALRSATRGAPLFVLHAVRAIGSARGNTGEYARALVAGSTPGRSAQEVLLEGTAQALDHSVGRVASGLAAVDAGLRANEWVALLERSLRDDVAEIRRALRSLVDRQIAYETQHGVVALHDAFRPLLATRFLSGEDARRVKESAAEILRAELLDERASERIVAYVRILASLRRLSELADVANALSEWFRETGTIDEVRGHLEAAIGDTLLDSEDRFWAQDALAFFDLDADRIDVAAERLSEMERLVVSLDDNARGALQHKRMLIALARGDMVEVRNVLSRPATTPAHARILRYHAAVAEARAGDARAAVRKFLECGSEYLTALGLTERMVFAKNAQEVRALMRPGADTADMRHLADCYFAVVRFGGPYEELRPECALRAIWAMKFYDLAGAKRSALRAGQDVVDMMMGVWDDPEAARSFMEQSLLPAVTRARLPEMTIPIRAQYAVVCAHCGEFAKATELMAQLAPYAEGLPPQGRAELERQRQLVVQLEERGPLSAEAAEARRRRIEDQLRRTEQLKSLLSADPAPRVGGVKVGRNEPCPCGTGRKFKKCCGA